MNFFNMGPGEMILILVIALIVFGPGKLPEMGSALGRSIREFRRATSDLTRELTGGLDENAQPVAEAGPAAAAATKACPRCGAANPADNLYCAECGAWMALDVSLAGATAVACPQCNALNPSGNKFCRACGTRLPAQEAPVAVAETTFSSSYPAAVPDVPQLPLAEEPQAAEAADEANPAGGESESQTAALPATEEMPLHELPPYEGGTESTAVAEQGVGEAETTESQGTQVQDEQQRSAVGEDELEKATAVVAAAEEEPVGSRPAGL
jgi:TatA/E family protein of Tat protein translocase